MGVSGHGWTNICDMWVCHKRVPIFVHTACIELTIKLATNSISSSKHEGAHISKLFLKKKFLGGVWGGGGGGGEEGVTRWPS